MRQGSDHLGPQVQDARSTAQAGDFDFSAIFSDRTFYLVRPAGRPYLEVKVLYSPDKGKS